MLESKQIVLGEVFGRSESGITSCLPAAHQFHLPCLHERSSFSHFGVRPAAGARSPRCADVYGAARASTLWCRLIALEDLQKALAASAECVQLRKRGATWSFSELREPAEAIARLRVEGTSLEPITILELARLCEQVMSARAAIMAEREESPVLTEIVASLPRELNSITARVANKILPSGDLDDRASPELARIRHEITKLRSSITRSLENLMRRAEEAVQDELVTIRNDRFVIPVKADHRGHIKGVAHGFSSSGATAFVEPLETIDANNELQSLRETEEREIYRILFALTEELRLQLTGIEMAAAAIAELDFINAKAVFHQNFNCVIPRISEWHRLQSVIVRWH